MEQEELFTQEPPTLTIYAMTEFVANDFLTLMLDVIDSLMSELAPPNNNCPMFAIFSEFGPHFLVLI